MALSNKRKAFVEEYLKDFNAAQAAIRAGYTENSARNQGHRLITNDDIAKEIQQRIEEKAMAADEVLILLADQARGSLEDFADTLGSSWNLNFDKAKAAGKLHLIKKLKENKDGQTEIELYDAQSALVQIGRHHGLFLDKTEVEQSGNININVTYESDGNATETA